MGGRLDLTACQTLQKFQSKQAGIRLKLPTLAIMEKTDRQTSADSKFQPLQAGTEQAGSAWCRAHHSFELAKFLTTVC